MARSRQKKKKAGLFSFLKLPPKARKRLIQTSLLFNLVLLTFFIFTIRRDGFAVTFQHVGTFISAPFSTLKWPAAASIQLPKIGSSKNVQGGGGAARRLSQPWTRNQPQTVPTPVTRWTPPIPRTLSDSKLKLVF
ncbi:MAG: hypothetical protein KBC91_06850 [Candidatus Omnitrophica bacterium]|nr:hypothetical protein [Candidatus Omnitrophota bacterium]